MLFFVASALLASAEPTAAPVQAPAPAPAAKPKKICHTEEAVIGSITSKRVCFTVPQAAPAPVQQPAQDAARDKPEQASSASGGNN
ncbi:MAG: hypothetical protein JOZ20_07840 [Sphingomonas sp.]|nr:hypothetical protein [Sphingomonas sp.]MBW0007097.1 hypothetical protein [Sphingomonas sp.]